MDVLKQTSPQAEAGAPNPSPWNTEPSSRAKIAFIASPALRDSRDVRERPGAVKVEGGQVCGCVRENAAGIRSDPCLSVPIRGEFNKTLCFSRFTRTVNS